MGDRSGDRGSRESSPCVETIARDAQLGLGRVLP
jgi:hypothetical protein